MKSLHPYSIASNASTFNTWYNEISVPKILITIKIAAYCAIIGVVNKNGIPAGKICSNPCTRTILITIATTDKNNACTTKLFAKYEFFVPIAFNTPNCCVFVM